ncbi:hypothetical protein [uncultured Tateyamaria sp.]|uniref:hypothetical protein n=1 Tax=uncultured Tateyamaria sp. TaxID=455651 RepID=UPI002605D3AB|nr:hypothetical protein [uncultured Tateyamaria sp.]
MAVFEDMMQANALQGKDPAIRRRITRASLAPLAGIEAASLAGIRSALATADLSGDPSHWLAADLSLGSWACHHLGNTLRVQLGQTAATEGVATEAQGPGREQRDGMSSAALIGELVDAESRGNTGIIAALDHAQVIAAALAAGPPRSVLVIAPRFDIGWRQDDIACLRFLAFALCTTPTRLILVAADRHEAGLPDDFDIRWSTAQDAPQTQTEPRPLAALMPSVISAGLSARLGVGEIPREHIARLTDGSTLIDPALRARPSARLRHLFDRLGAILGLDPALKAFAQLNGSGYHADPVFLVRQAWHSFTIGGHEIALDLMAHAVACAPDTATRGRFLYELQGMRIALQKFDEARMAPAPDPSLPSETRAGIILTRGWGAALSGHPQEGREHLATALAMLRGDIGDDSHFLYFKNIYALSLVRTGAWDAALGLEKEIEASLDTSEAETGCRDWPMTYVNSLNQARLYKYHKDFDRSFAYYQRGFATTLGARSESDAVYANFCLAKLHAQHGQDHAAFLCWFRTALHWVAADIPEALAMRVAAGILARRTGPYEPVADRISEVIGEELSAAARRIGLAPGADPPEMVFCRQPTPNEAGTGLLIGAAGWAAILMPDTGMGPAVSTPPHDRLRRLLSGLIRQAAPQATLPARCLAMLPCEGTGEMPLSRDDAWLSAARYGVRKLIYDAHEMTLTPDEQAALLARRHVRHGFGVSTWAQKSDKVVHVTFKRNLRALTLRGLEAGIFAQAASPVPHAQLATDRCRVEAIDRLERAGLLASMAP